MNQTVLAKLKKWRAQKADLEKCELYRIFQNKTLEDIATILPTDKEGLLAIKGVGQKKFEKYGREVFEFIAQGFDVELAPKVNQKKDKTYSVSDYLDNINFKLAETNAKIKGEVSSLSIKGHLYFSLKDAKDGSVLNCFMWSRDYEICGVEIVEGMELTIHGFPEIYKPNGRFTFRTSAIELVGEGALKQAYDELKKKLELEGLFDESRKKAIPDFPTKIGLITSRDGAVINDFMSNIGRFGYQIKFVDSRVEGIMAVKDLLVAVKFFKENSVDVLVMIRGGGSLESLQAFNNESLLREVASLDIPVFCGIGHDKDVPLLAFVADRAASTPSIVAKEINASWERGIDKLKFQEKSIINSYGSIIKETRVILDNSSFRLKEFYQEIFRRFEYYQQSLKNLFSNMSYILKRDRERLEKVPKILTSYFEKTIIEVLKKIDSYEKLLNQNNPERQLKLGYSILMCGGKVVKSIKDVQSGDALVSRLSDGSVESQAK